MDHQESGGTETVIDATTAQVRGTADLGGAVGNVAYDPVADQMLVAVQGKGDLAAIDPDTLNVTRSLPPPGCSGGHGLALDPPARLAFVACEDNATLLTVDLATWQSTGTAVVGTQPRRPRLRPRCAPPLRRRRERHRHRVRPDGRTPHRNRIRTPRRQRTRRGGRPEHPHLLPDSRRNRRPSPLLEQAPNP
ncbi:YncE family protein [Rhodococcus koreensis]|uniref:YncE family protein n=1 Tax=Rhodococcus koreensis TaxID=99653 RepID=UPI0036DAA9F9